MLLSTKFDTKYYRQFAGCTVQMYPVASLHMWNLGNARCRFLAQISRTLATTQHSSHSVHWGCTITLHWITTCSTWLQMAFPAARLKHGLGQWNGQWNAWCKLPFPMPELSYLVANMGGHPYLNANISAFLQVTVANNLTLPQSVKPSLVWNETEFNSIYSVFVVINWSEGVNNGVWNGNLISI